MMLRIIISFWFLFVTSFIYGADSSSGCGPAWYLFKDKSLLSSSLRSITNGILWPISTLGMTFGTSNCGKHSIVNLENRSEHLVMVTSEKLRQDAAKGDGVFLKAYSDTFGCSKKSYPIFAKSVQSNFKNIFLIDFSANSAVKKTKILVHFLPQLRGQCSKV